MSASESKTALQIASTSNSKHHLILLFDAFAACALLHPEIAGEHQDKLLSFMQGKDCASRAPGLSRRRREKKHVLQDLQALRQLDYELTADSPPIFPFLREFFSTTKTDDCENLIDGMHNWIMAWPEAQAIYNETNIIEITLTYLNTKHPTYAIALLAVHDAMQNLEVICIKDFIYTIANPMIFAEALIWCNDFHTLDLSNVGTIPNLQMLLIMAAIHCNPNLTTLDLSGQRSLHIEIFLSMMLEENHPFISLNLDNTIISHNVVRKVCEYLMTNTTLKSLDLTCGVGLHKDDTEMFLTALRQNKTLENLKLNFLIMYNVEWHPFAKIIGQHTSLKKLELGLTRFTQEKMAELFDYLRHNTSLQSLIFDSSSSIDIDSDHCRRIVDALRENNTLLSLGLRIYMDESALPIFAAFLGKNQSITELDLSSCDLKDSDIALICGELLQNRTLTSLSLGSNKIGAIGMQALEKWVKTHPTFKSLDLTAALHEEVEEYELLAEMLAATIARILQSSKTLSTLKLVGIYFEEKALQTIAEALENNHTVTTLGIGGYFDCDESKPPFNRLLQRNRAMQAELQQQQSEIPQPLEADSALEAAPRTSMGNTRDSMFYHANQSVTTGEDFQAHP